MSVMQKMDNLMKPIPSEIKILYDALLVKRGVPLTAHFYYRKWLRYYLDFCFKYHHEKSKKESLLYFIKKLKNKTEQQQKQAFQEVSIFYGIRARSKTTWHFCIPTSLYLSSIFIRKNPRNSPLFLRFCSIRSMKSTANLGANSTNLFLTEP